MSREYTCADWHKIAMASKRKLERKEQARRYKEEPRTMTIPPGFFNQSKKNQISYVESKLNRKLTAFFSKCPIFENGKKEK